MSDVTHDPDVLELDEATTAVIDGVVPTDELPAFFDRSFPALVQAIADQDAGMAGAAFARYRRPPGATADLEIGFPTVRPVVASGDVRPGTLPGGRAARLVHVGGYDELPASWARLRSWAEAAGITAGGDPWEVYVTEPSPDMDPADLRTELYLPLAV